LRIGLKIFLWISLLKNSPIFNSGGFLLYLYIMKDKELFKRMIIRVMKKQYPFIVEIEVSADRDMHSHYIDKEKNMIYNVFFKINDWGDFDDWKKFEDDVLDIRDAIGLNGRVRFYYLEAGSEDDYGGD